MLPASANAILCQSQSLSTPDVSLHLPTPSSANRTAYPRPTFPCIFTNNTTAPLRRLLHILSTLQSASKSRLPLHADAPCIFTNNATAFSSRLQILLLQIFTNNACNIFCSPRSAPLHLHQQRLELSTPPPAHPAHLHSRGIDSHAAAKDCLYESGWIFALHSEAMRVMRSQEKGGHIFNMDGAGSGGSSTPLTAVYGSTKCGLRQLQASLLKECKRSKVGVHTTSPGMVLTDLLLSGSSLQNKQMVNIICDLPETVARTLFPRMRVVKGSGKSINYLTPPRILLALITTWLRRG